IGSESGHVQIYAAVIVEVAGRRTHAVAPGAQTARVRHVREAQRAAAGGLRLQIVPEQATPERREIVGAEERAVERLVAEHPPLDDEDVEVAVVVVVEQADPGGHSTTG